MIKLVIGIIISILGLSLWPIGSAYRWLITSDIPISFSSQEAMAVKVIFTLSIILLLLGGLIAASKAYRLGIGILFSLVFVISLSINLFIHRGAEYYTGDFAQLANVSVIYALGVAVFHIYLAYSRDKRHTSAA